MIAVIKKGTTEAQLENLTSWLKSQGLDVHLSRGSTHTIVGLVGDTSKIDADLLGSLDIVESVKRISEPFKSANRKFHPDDSV
ncbi:MAG: 3-deoxy-7-phosphoheptulonate synthase, partial [Clostridia bacterium]|nr:3-deoxy-7-phosphoheptulonate synthase [Clostridia bacterium]